MSVIAIDVGGTRIKGAVVAEDGTVVYRGQWPTQAEQDADALVEFLVRIAEKLLGYAADADDPAVAAGIVVPGIVNEGAGVAAFAANLAWRDTPLRALLGRRLNMPVAFGHDVRTGGLAEACLGAGRGSSHFTFMPVGTGIAAALVIDGVPLTSTRGLTGEVGHMVVRQRGERCRCGNRGCLETIASASAISRRYGMATGESGVSAREVQIRAEAGDAAAGWVWGEAVVGLADGLATITMLLDPERIVIGGGLAQAGDSLLVPLRSAVAERLVFRDVPPIVLAELGDQAGCLGAALLAQRLIGCDAA